MFSPRPPIPATPDLAAEFSQFLEHLDDGVILLDRAWRIAYANANARRISRIQPEQLNSLSHWELYPATVGTAQEEIYRRSMEQRVSLEHEFYYAPYDLWISLRTYPVPLGIAVHYRDVSRIRRAEARRDDTVQQLARVLETTTDAIAVLDRSYNFVFLNQRGRMLLAPSGEVLGRNLWAAFPDLAYADRYRHAMEDRIGGSFEAFYPEPLNIWFSIGVHPDGDEGIVIFFRDITAERASAEELLRKTAEAERQAAEIETVYRTAPIGLALFDTDEFRYLRLNDRQAAFFGLRAEQVLGRTLTEMAPIPGLRELFEQVRDGHPVVNHLLEGELISHPGEHRYWTVNYFPVYASDGSIRAISAASLEITAQKKAEQALIQSEKLAAVGRLASSISHEINNPLEAVTNLLYLVATDPLLPPTLKSYIELTQSEVARVSQIATQTLRFHRQAARPTLVTAEQLLDPVLKLYQGRLTNSEIVVESRLDTPLQILCLENEIRQVLSNLIANAIDAMRSGGRLILRSHPANGLKDGAPGIRLTIADTGHGMSPATMTRIFEPFFTTKELNGTGLGLWISAEIIQRHHGHLAVRSSQNKQHHGTVFALFLPTERIGPPQED